MSLPFLSLSLSSHFLPHRESPALPSSLQTLGQQEAPSLDGPPRGLAHDPTSAPRPPPWWVTGQHSYKEERR